MHRSKKKRSSLSYLVIFAPVRDMEFGLYLQEIIKFSLLSDRVIGILFNRKPDHFDNFNCRYHCVQFFCGGSMRQCSIIHLYPYCCQQGKIDNLNEL